MDEVEWWEFETPAEMAKQAAGDIRFVIDSAIEAHKGARIAVPVGRTPEIVHRALLAMDIDWPKVTLIPTGDRLVPLGHELSTWRRLGDLYAGKGAEIVSLVDEAALDDYREAGRLADARLALLDWPLDLVWLGMGGDGHTAAIFPGPDLDRALAGPRERRAVGVRPDPKRAGGPDDRVTLTAAALASARTVTILVGGDEKKRLLEKAIEDGPLSSTPIGRVLAEIDVPVDIFWSAQE
jgi:6-phosphogluconolactonase